MKDKKLKRNVITGFVGQFIAIAIGFIVPRIFITIYGSDINGLLSTITQIFTYMALLEAGIAQAAKNLLFKPFQDKDREGISDIASIARAYYGRFTIIYAVGVVVLSMLLPVVLKTNVDFLSVSLIVMLEGLSGVISFYFIQTPSIIISVDGKNYVNNSINLLNKIISNIAKIVLASFGFNVVFLQVVYFIITVAKVFFYKVYFRNKYGWLKYKKVGREVKLQDRNSYILTEICWTIFSSTDMIILSTFYNTQMSSVYSIYNMVFTNISLLVNSVFFSVNYLLGYAYHDDIKKYERLHDSFNSIFIGIMTILMSVSYCLTLPFVKLYTRGVNDINYVYPMLPLMFCLIQLLSWCRFTSGQLTGIAGYAKPTSYVSVVEALMNLVLSIVLVKKFGIIGVTFATVIALPVKVIWCTYVADVKVMKRSCWKSVSIIGANGLIFLAVVMTYKYLQLVIESYFQFILWGIVLSGVIGLIVFGVNVIINRECWDVIKKYILKLND